MQKKRLTSLLPFIKYFFVDGMREQSVLLSRELDSFQNRIQPLLNIISDLQSDSVISHRVSIYLNDVKDHVQQVIIIGLLNMQLLNDIQYCSNRSNNVYNLVQTMREKRQDRILLILTLITAFFTPISFLAGVYGMNFDYMPVVGYYLYYLQSLHWKFGYLYFWLYVIIIVTVLSVSLRYIMKRV